MKLSAVFRTFITIFLIEFLTPSNKFERPMIPTASACLPRIPNLWPVLRRSGSKDSEPDTPFDKQAEERSHWTTNDWIERHKYALELHNVTTEDGYQLQMQRLPKPGHRPILLVHGLLTSSLSWVLMGPGKSLAFLLYDKKYDVWLANLRGSAYGRSHTCLNVSDANFWSYSFHEHGIYDLPALVDYIRNVSAFHQVLLIGHSQAFNAFLAMCAVHPVYNERILFIQALAPLAKLKHMVKFDIDDVKMIMKYVKKKKKAHKYELFPPGELSTKCLKRNSDERRECLRIFRMIAGNGQHSRSLDPLLFGKLLQGGSLKEITHLHQIWLSGDFASFDYGVLDNRKYYNSVEPQIYDLKRITVPMVLHFGETDALATPTGVHSIYSRLINSVAVYGVHRVAAASFNHLDFLISRDVKTLVNDKLIEIMENYFAGKLNYVID